MSKKIVVVVVVVVVVANKNTLKSQKMSGISSHLGSVWFCGLRNSPNNFVKNQNQIRNEKRCTGDGLCECEVIPACFETELDRLLTFMTISSGLLSAGNNLQMLRYCASKSVSSGKFGSYPGKSCDSISQSLSFLSFASCPVVIAKSSHDLSVLLFNNKRCINWITNALIRIIDVMCARRTGC